MWCRAKKPHPSNKTNSLHTPAAKHVQQAYHKPTYEINAGATYAIADKFRLQMDLLSFSSMKTTDYQLGGIQSIAGGTDLNLSIDYKIFHFCFFEFL